MNIQKIMQFWHLNQVKIIKKFDVSGERQAVAVGTEAGDFFLKGIPISVEEAIIQGNVKAQTFLAKHHDLAPELIPLPNNALYIIFEGYYYYLMTFIEGRPLEETVSDLYLLGKASAVMHQLEGYAHVSSIQPEQHKAIYRTWFETYPFHDAFQRIVDELPNFDEMEQCFIHTDIGPHNALLRDTGAVCFVDLDDAGYGSRYVDVGWPFIMQFVDYNRSTGEMTYKDDLAIAFLKGYYGDDIITEEAVNNIWSGAVFMHISYMQCFGTEAVPSLWRMLQYGMAQRERIKALVITE